MSNNNNTIVPEPNTVCQEVSPTNCGLQLEEALEILNTRRHRDYNWEKVYTWIEPTDAAGEELHLTEFEAIAIAEAYKRLEEAEKKPKWKMSKESLEAFWKAYPARKGLKIGKKKAIDWLIKNIGSPDEQGELALALRNYKAYCEQSEQLPRDAIRWLQGDWREWLEVLPITKQPTPKRWTNQAEINRSGQGRVVV
jgi:hypothetical protein